MILLKHDPEIIIPGGPVPWSRDELTVTSQMLTDDKKAPLSRMIVRPKGIGDVRKQFFRETSLIAEEIGAGHRRMSYQSHAETRPPLFEKQKTPEHLREGAAVLRRPSSTFSDGGRHSLSPSTAPLKLLRDVTTQLSPSQSRFSFSDGISPQKLSPTPSPQRTYLTTSAKSPNRPSSTGKILGGIVRRGYVEERHPSLASVTSSNSDSDLSSPTPYTPIIYRPDVVAVPLPQRAEYIRRLALHQGSEELASIPRARPSPPMRHPSPSIRPASPTVRPQTLPGVKSTSPRIRPPSPVVRPSSPGVRASSPVPTLQQMRERLLASGHMTSSLSMPTAAEGAGRGVARASSLQQMLRPEDELSTPLPEDPPALNTHKRSNSVELLRESVLRQEKFLQRRLSNSSSSKISPPMTSVTPVSVRSGARAPSPIVVKKPSHDDF